MLALPGSAYLYQGEELGLGEVADIPAERVQDPVFTRSGGTRKGSSEEPDGPAKPRAAPNSTSTAKYIQAMCGRKMLSVRNSALQTACRPAARL